MNSFNRPRRRPRVESISWRVFGWVLLREASLRVLFPHSVGAFSETQARRTLAAEENWRVRDTARLALAVDPDRAVFTPRATEVVGAI
jgi:hypothetical protein